MPGTFPIPCCEVEIHAFLSYTGARHLHRRHRRHAADGQTAAGRAAAVRAGDHLPDLQRRLHLHRGAGAADPVQPGDHPADQRTGDPELDPGLVPARLCAAAVRQTGDGHPQRADPGVGAAASAHHSKRPGRVAKGDGDLLAGGGAVGRGGVKRHPERGPHAPGRAGAAAFAHPDRPAPVQRQPAGAAPGRDLAGTDAGQKGAYPQPGAGIAGKRPAHPAGRQKAGGNRRISRPGKANARRKTRFRRAAQKGSEVF